MRTLALDLDGTLVDTVGMLFDAFNVFIEAARAPQLLATSFDGLTVPAIIERVRAAVPETASTTASFQDAARAYLAALDAIYETRAPAYDGVDEALRAFAAAGVRLCLVTSAEERYTTPLLARMRWAPLFLRVEHATASRSKEIIFRELRAGGEVTVVEDSTGGVRAAVRAGVPVVGVAAHEERRHVLWREGAFVVASTARDALQAAHVGAAWLAKPHGDVDVKVIERLPQSTRARDAVQRLWEERRAQAPHLFDGPILTVHDVTLGDGGEGVATVRASQASYRDLIAARSPDIGSDADLLAELRLRPLGVTGVVRAGDDVVIGKRAAHVSSFAGAWELPPSGSVEHADDLLSQWLSELREELGAAVCAQARVAGVLSSADGTVDVVYVAECDDRPTIPAQTPEYSELRWVNVAELAAWASSPSVSMVPATRLLAQHLATLRGGKAVVAA